jgi:hypothetical protein
MATKNTLFTVAGITTHRGQDANGTVSERTKLRFGTDLVRMIKMLSNPKKIEDKTLGICLAPVRVQMVDLPQPMLKDDATRFLLSHSDFQSPEDQSVINDTIEHRAPKQKSARAKSSPKVRATLAELSLDSIKSRARKTDSTVTVEDVLATVAE